MPDANGIIASCAASSLGIAAAGILVSTGRRIEKGDDPRTNIILTAILGIFGITFDCALIAGWNKVAIILSFLVSMAGFAWMISVGIKLLGQAETTTAVTLLALTLTTYGLTEIASELLPLGSVVPAFPSLHIGIPCVACLLARPYLCGYANALRIGTGKASRANETSMKQGEFARKEGREGETNTFFGTNSKRGNPENGKSAIPLRFAFHILSYSLVFGMTHTIAGKLTGADRCFPTYLGALGAALIIMGAFSIGMSSQGEGKSRGDVWPRMRAIIFPLVMISFMMLPFIRNEGQTLFVFMAECARMSYFVFFLLTCLSIARKTSINPIEVTAKGAIILSASLACGGLLGLALLSNLDLTSYSTIIIVVFLLLTAGTFWVGDDRTIALAWGKEKKLTPAKYSESIAGKQCQKAIATYSLTKREGEILTMLLNGNSITTIAKTETISLNTVRAHVSHIHQKTGAHTQQELCDLVRSIEV